MIVKNYLCKVLFMFLINIESTCRCSFCQKQTPEVFSKRVALKNFATFTEKPGCFLTVSMVEPKMYSFSIFFICQYFTNRLIYESDIWHVDRHE